jgi:hypothetical protein
MKGTDAEGAQLVNEAPRRWHKKWYKTPRDIGFPVLSENPGITSNVHQNTKKDSIFLLLCFLLSINEDHFITYLHIIEG